MPYRTVLQHMGQAIRDHQSQVADALTVGSATGYGATLLAEVDYVISIIAGILVAVSAALSIYLHVRNMRDQKPKK